MTNLRNKGRSKQNIEWDERAYVGRKYYCNLTGDVVELLSLLTLVFRHKSNRVVRSRASVTELRYLELFMLGEVRG